jgi:hypothetical protein
VFRWEAVGLAGGGRVGGAQLRVRDAPDALDTVARANEECGRSQRYECQKQGVLDQILALFVAKKAD